jgi:hypothetical protein
MNYRTLRVLYWFRLPAFVAWCLALTLGVWLLIWDVAIRHPIGAILLNTLWQTLGFLPAVDHGMRGVMGLWPASLMTHWALCLTGVLWYLGTHLAVLRPRRRWVTHLGQAKFDMVHVWAAALMPAMLTVGLLATILEPLGLWSRLGEWPWWPQRHYMGGSRQSMTVVLDDSFWLAMPLLLLSWVAWRMLLKRLWARGDRYWHLVAFTYVLFMVAGLELFLSGMMLVRTSFIEDFWKVGSYTGAALSAGVLLWAGGAGVMLLYTSREYLDQKGVAP